MSAEFFDMVAKLYKLLQSFVAVAAGQKYQ